MVSLVRQLVICYSVTIVIVKLAICAELIIVSSNDNTNELS